MFYGMAIQLNLEGFLDIWHLTITLLLQGHLGYIYPCSLKSVCDLDGNRHVWDPLDC